MEEVEASLKWLDLSSPRIVYEDEDQEKVFRQAVSSISFSKLPEYVLKLRHAFNSTKPSTSAPKTWDGRLSGISSPMMGSYNILFPIEFSDGLRWLLKIRAALAVPETYTNEGAAGLKSEALTMRLIERKTTIPIPGVIAYDTGFENDVGCPYMIIDFIDAKPLYDIWFDQKRSKEEREVARHRTLSDIAHSMVQLHQFEFDSSGSILFDEHDLPCGTGPAICRDSAASLENIFREDRRDDDGIVDDVNVNMGPFHTTQAYLSRWLDLHPGQSGELEGQFDEKRVARMFFSWLPDQIHESEKDFVLIHPDYNIQNFLVADDGSLKGIIDWDSACAEPRAEGNESVPGWLDRDWDPAYYGYESSMDEGVEPEGLWEDSPETLDRHRTQYQELIGQHMLEYLKTSRADLNDKQRQDLIHLAVTRSRNSALVRNLGIAASSPVCLSPTLHYIFDKFCSTTEDNPFKLSDVATSSKVSYENDDKEKEVDESQPATPQLGAGPTIEESDTEQQNPREKGNAESRVEARVDGTAKVANADACNPSTETDDSPRQDLEFFDILDALKEGSLDEKTVDFLKRGFESLIHHV